jgi:5-enolpyruvylshikimate-3-phosphate synthase
MFPDAVPTLYGDGLFAGRHHNFTHTPVGAKKPTACNARWQSELRKVGAIVEEGADYIKITPSAISNTQMQLSILTTTLRMVQCAFPLVSGWRADYQY